MPNMMITVKWNTPAEDWKNVSLNLDKKMFKDGYGIEDNDCIILSSAESSLIGKTLTGDTIIINAHAGNGTLGFSAEQRLRAPELFKILIDLQGIQQLKKIVLYACSMGVGVDAQEFGSFASTLATFFAERDMAVEVYAPLGICAFNENAKKFLVRKNLDDNEYLDSNKSWARCQSTSKEVTVHITSEPEMPNPVSPKKAELSSESDDYWFAQMNVIQ